MYDKIQQTAEYIKQQTKTSPKIGVILGSGLGSFADNMKVECRLAYKDIPNFPISTVKGHKGELLFGKMGNNELVCMQ